MLLLFRIAARNLFRHPTKTLLIGVLIAVGVASLFCADAVFESTARGLEASYIGSVTGDIAVGAAGEEVFGLFGSEVPIVSEYESIPAVAEYASILETLHAQDAVAHTSPVVSSLAQVAIGSFTLKAPVFGVDPNTYFSVCSEIRITSGDIAAISSGGVFLNAALADQASKALGRPLSIGEPVVFTMTTGSSFRVRKGTFAGIFRYPAPTDIMDRIVLADPVIVRSLCDYTLGYAKSKKAEESTAQDDISLDELFSDSVDIAQVSYAGTAVSDMEAALSDTAKRDALVMTDSAAWSFILARTKSGADVAATRRSIQNALRKNRAEARVMDWMTAAGSGALMLFAVRGAFNVGIGVLILGAVLVITNALVISVLERTNEIGSMRAIGASRGFIRSLFIMETMTLTFVSALAGIIVGVVVCAFLWRKGIPLTNPLLATLFGGSVVRPVVGLGAIVSHLLGALIIGAFAWVYPVALALRIQPVSAMNERS